MIKILKDLGDNKYEVEIPENKVKGRYRKSEFGLVHDYFYASGNIYPQKENGSVSDRSFRGTVQIPIRDFIQVMIPYINANPYSKEEHIKDRVDKEGTYIPYSYNNNVIQYYDSDKKCMMVSVKQQGEKIYNTMTVKFFNEFVEPNLKYV